MISINDYPLFLENIKGLDKSIQNKLISILEEKVKGNLPKNKFCVEPELSEYDYTFNLDEKLIPFFDIFDKYFYPSADKLIPDNITPFNISNADFVNIIIFTK